MMKTLKSPQLHTLNFTSLQKMDSMTNEEYAFFLAYGVEDDNQLQTQELLDEYFYSPPDVEM